MFSLGMTELFILVAMGGAFNLPIGVPPLPPDPLVMRAVPEECLFYVGWNGATTPDPKSGNQTERLLAEDEIREFVERLDLTIRAAVRRASARDPASAAVVEELPELVQT